MKEILERLEWLNSQTTISLAVKDPALYKKYMNELNKLQKQLYQMTKQKS